MRCVLTFSWYDMTIILIQLVLLKYMGIKVLYVKNDNIASNTTSLVSTAIILQTMTNNESGR